MEIISYISATDGFTHYILVNSLGIPFFFYVLLLAGSCGLVVAVLRRIICGGD